MPHLSPVAVLLTLVAAPLTPALLAGQETPTERSAAAGVIRRMNDLERSLALPQLVARLTGRDARRDAVVLRAKQLMDKELLAMADDITRHPEVGHKEERSVGILTDWLKAHDFDVETGVAGLKTAFVARYRKGTPGPNLGVIVEYDALRGTTRDFHGDQHSAQGPVGLAAALAVAEFLTSSRTPGTVTVYGTPAEELAGQAAKTTMYNAGVFKGVDVLVRSHSSTATQTPAAGFGSCCMNIDVVRFTFSGAPAHQLQAWDGRDALTGVIELFNHIDAIRRTLRPETRIQGIVTEGGKAPNVVPDRAAAEFWLRYPDPVYLAQVLDRVSDAARAAALPTGNSTACAAFMPTTSRRCGRPTRSRRCRSRPGNDRLVAHPARRCDPDDHRLPGAARRAAAHRHAPAGPDVHLRPRVAAHHRERGPERHGGTRHESRGWPRRGGRADRVASGNRLVAAAEPRHRQAARRRRDHADPQRPNARGAPPPRRHHARRAAPGAARARRGRRRHRDARRPRARRGDQRGAVRRHQAGRPAASAHPGPSQESVGPRPY